MAADTNKQISYNIRGTDVEATIQQVLLGEHTGHKVRLHCWVHNKRDSKNVAFLILKEGADTLQSVVSASNKKLFDEVVKVDREASVVVEGIVKKDERAQGGYELSLENVIVVGGAPDFPITKKEHTDIDFLLNLRHLWLRSPKQAAIQIIKADVLKSIRKFLDEKGYFELFPPILTGVKGEGGSDVFSLKYFDTKAYLSQTAQLYLEAGLFPLKKTYALTPSFRAEKSNTTRHLTEYWHLEIEEAWMDFEGLKKIMEEMVCRVVFDLLNTRRKELMLAREDDLSELEKIKAPFPRVSYDKAIEILQKKGFKIKWGEDFGTVEEKAVCEEFGVPILIYEFPRKIKAFYMKEGRMEKGRETVLGCDLIAPGGFGEIIGGSVRETDYDSIAKRLKENKEKVETYGWYLDLRKYGSVPHVGFGLGTERLVRWLCKLENIREAALFARAPNRLFP